MILSRAKFASRDTRLLKIIMTGKNRECSHILQGRGAQVTTGNPKISEMLAWRSQQKFTLTPRCSCLVRFSLLIAPLHSFLSITVKKSIFDVGSGVWCYFTKSSKELTDLIVGSRFHWGNARACILIRSVIYFRSLRFSWGRKKGLREWAFFIELSLPAS